MRVEELCTPKVAVERPEQTVREACRRMQDERLGTLVVVDDLQRPLGIATDRDLAMRCLGPELNPAQTPLSRVMSAPVAWVHAQAPVADALEEMARLRVRRLVVVDERERLVGILTFDDVLGDVLSRDLGPDSAATRVLRATMG